MTTFYLYPYYEDWFVKYMHQIILIMTSTIIIKYVLYK